MRIRSFFFVNWENSNKFAGTQIEKPVFAYIKIELCTWTLTLLHYWTIMQKKNNNKNGGDGSNNSR